MFFIVRCIFWLSVVYVHLPAADMGGLPSANAFMDLAARHADGMARQATAQAAGGAIDFCKTHAQTCFGEAMASVEATPKPVARPKAAEKAKAEDKTVAAKPASDDRAKVEAKLKPALATDTLTAADREPRWSLRKG